MGRYDDMNEIVSLDEAEKEKEFFVTKVEEIQLHIIELKETKTTERHPHVMSLIEKDIDEKEREITRYERVISDWDIAIERINSGGEVSHRDKPSLHHRLTI